MILRRWFGLDGLIVERVGGLIDTYVMFCKYAWVGPRELRQISHEQLATSGYYPRVECIFFIFCLSIDVLFCDAPVFIFPSYV